MTKKVKKETLRITDTLNYEIFKNMTLENRKLMAMWRAKALLNSNVVNMKNNTEHKEIPIGDTTKYKVSAEFTVIDFQLNKKGVLTASMVCQRNGEDIDVEVSKIRYKEL